MCGSFPFVESFIPFKKSKFLSETPNPNEREKTLVENVIYLSKEPVVFWTLDRVLLIKDDFASLSILCEGSGNLCIGNTLG